LKKKKKEKKEAEAKNYRMFGMNIFMFKVPQDLGLLNYDSFAYEEKELVEVGGNIYVNWEL
jgi:hypothetical protein